MYNSADILVGEGQTNVEAHHNSPFHGYLELYVPIAGMTESGRFKVYFVTPLFNYGPLVIPYG
jgi:hypothetical protein